MGIFRRRRASETKSKDNEQPSTEERSRRASKELSKLRKKNERNKHYQSTGYSGDGGFPFDGGGPP